MKENILIVDDNINNLRLLSSLLSQNGYEVRIANNGESALESIYEEPPHLILLDINMPGMDGFEVCQRLKRDTKTSSIPVIFISAVNNKEYIIQAFDIGAIDYITKPFLEQEVIARIKTHLKLYQLQNRLEQKVHERTSELIKSRTKYYNLIQLSPQVIILVDFNGKILYANERINEWIGAKSIVEKKLNQLPILPASLRRILLRFHKGLNYQDWSPYEIEFKDQKDHVKTGLVYTRLIDSFDNDKPYILVMISDITERKEAEKAIQEKNDFLLNIIESLPHPFSVINVNDCTLALANSATKKNQDLIGNTCYQSYHHSMQPCNLENKDIECPMEIIKKTKKPVIVEHRHYDANNHLKICEVHAYPLFHNGQVSQMIEYDLDITDRKKIEQNLKKLSLAVDSAHDAILFIDLNKKISYANQSACEILGYTSEEILQININQFMNSQELVSTMFSTVEKNGGWNGTVIAVRKNKELFSAVLSASIIKDEKDQILGMMALFRDITIEEKAEELRLAKEAAETANQFKSHFLANMSHEIRTPMNAVIGMSHLLQQSNLTNKQQDYIEKIDLAAHQLLRIINDILDFSKIEAGKMNLESIEFFLDDVLNNAIFINSVKAKEKNIDILFDIDSDIPVVMVGDPLRLGQILINLISNAIKFTDHGQISIQTKLTAKDEEKEKILLEFSVADTGIGMTEKQVAKLFRPFAQADGSTTRKFGGSGLGLAISKHFVEMMGGSISVESQFKKGSKFTFSVQLGLCNQEFKHRLISKSVLDGMKILIVDDNAISGFILNKMLHSFSFNTVIANNAERALEVLSENKDRDIFKLIILDYQLPGINGLELAKKIRTEMADYKDIKIIISSAYDLEGAKENTAGLDISCFLNKPITASQLFDTIMRTFTEDLNRSLNSTKNNKLNPAAIKLKISGLKVLLAEDNDINQLVARELLEQVGLDVTIVNNGLEALNSVQSQKFDIVLMDVQMPVMDGYEATSKIRNLADEQYQRLPIIAMTANAMVGDGQRSLDSGMNDHISKPINVYDLYTKIAFWSKKDIPLDFNKVKTETNYSLPLVPGIDFSEGLNHANQNQQLYLKLLKRFREKYGNIIAEIEEQSSQQDFQTAQRMAHTLKSVSANLGMINLAELSKELELNLKNSTENHNLTDNYKNLTKLLKGELTIVLDSLAKIPDLYNKESNLQEGIAKKENLISELEELKDYLEKARIDSEAKFKTIENFLMKEQPEETLLLKQHIEDFDYDKAMEKVSHLYELMFH
ncbi:MAG: response regulator [Spirochaetes bacterium]|nr:response regulator [Spirochaetota bacterium]